MHRPYFEPSVYGTAITGDIDNQNDLQSAFDDLFVQYGVRPFFLLIHLPNYTCCHTQHVAAIEISEISDSAILQYTLQFGAIC